MVEEFEFSHRISEDEILKALGNAPGPYFGGLAPTEELLELISTRINLDLRIRDVEYQLCRMNDYGLQLLDSDPELALHATLRVAEDPKGFGRWEGN